MDISTSSNEIYDLNFLIKKLREISHPGSLIIFYFTPGCFLFKGGFSYEINVDHLEYVTPLGTPISPPGI